MEANQRQLVTRDLFFGKTPKVERIAVKFHFTIAEIHSADASFPSAARSRAPVQTKGIRRSEKYVPDDWKFSALQIQRRGRRSPPIAVVISILLKAVVENNVAVVLGVGVRKRTQKGQTKKMAIHSQKQGMSGAFRCHCLSKTSHWPNVTFRPVVKMTSFCFLSGGGLVT